MKKNVRQHAQRPIPRLVIVLHAKHRAIQLCLLRLLQLFNLLLGLLFQRLAKSGSVLFHFVENARLILVAVLFSHLPDPFPASKSAQTQAPTSPPTGPAASYTFKNA